MTTSQCRTIIHQSLETKDSYTQAAIEGAALRGELGIERQLLAMSEQYKALKAAGRIDEANAVKAEAIKINESRN